MATPTNGTKLSLGKLGRATAVGNSNYTSKTSLNDCARDSGTGKTSISDFYIGSVDNSLDGYPYVDEQTNETYTMTFTDENSLFQSRIGGRYQNFTWTTDNASLFAIQSNQDYTAQYNAGTITDNTTPTGVAMESNLVTNPEFENWTAGNLDSWTESGTISENVSGATGSAVQFESNGAYIEQSFTVKGNSTYQFTAHSYTTNGTDSQINCTITATSAGHTLTRNAICGQQGDWYTFRDDFYTSGSSNVNDTVTIRFTGDIANSIYPSLDDITFQRWEGANFGDTNVEISGKFHEAGKSDGFNDHATRYDTAITKTVEIQDTYGGLSIACFLPGTMIQMSDGTEKDIEDINVGDEVLSVIIPNLPDEDQGYGVWKSFESIDDMTNLEVSSAKVEHIFYDYMDGYWSINSGLIKVTAEHDFWTYTGEKWEWYTPKQLSVGNKLLDYQGNLIEITSLENVEGEVEVVNFDVEPLDVYFAGSVLVHNKGSSSEP